MKVELVQRLTFSIQIASLLRGYFRTLLFRRKEIYTQQKLVKNIKYLRVFRTWNILDLCKGPEVIRQKKQNINHLTD